MHDLIVIGGGPAGLAAMAYMLSKQIDVVLICARFGGKAGERQRFAGQSERERLVGEEAIASFKRQISMCPERIVNATVIGLFKRDDVFHVLMERRTLHARAVIVATGAQPTLLGIRDEWDIAGRGLGYSVTTHTHAVAGLDVAVVGSTTRALRGVAELVQTARQITLIAPYPGQIESLLGQRLRESPKVQVLEGYQIKEIEVEGTVRAIVAVGPDDVRRIAVQAVFADLGLVPNVQLVRQLVRLDEQGFIVVDNGQRTSLPGLFAAGDVTDEVGEQILIAIGAGARAALSAYDYILAERLRLHALT